jgi:NAD(P)H-dependent flavin oxidoreductase YrpB (nitropropane dioxygenase family)
MFKTRITEMLGIKYPIIQGAMARLPQAELVSAVSDAGGLGNLAALSLPGIEELRQEIKTIKGLTDKPFCVNITISPRARTTAYEDYIEAAIEEGAGIFEIAGGNPKPYMKRLKDAGAKVIDKVGRIKDARAAEDVGVDAVSVIGFEAGGRPGGDRIGSIALIPMVVDSVKIPVIAGGGIGDARGFVAALALGAEGVLMGTRFMVSRECVLPPETENRFIEAKGNETVIVEHYANFFGRVLPLVGGDRGKQAVEKGERGAGYGCGQAIGLIHDAPNVKEIINRIIGEASLIKQRLHG